MLQHGVPDCCRTCRFEFSVFRSWDLKVDWCVIRSRNEKKSDWLGQQLVALIPSRTMASMEQNVSNVQGDEDHEQVLDRASPSPTEQDPVATPPTTARLPSSPVKRDRVPPPLPPRNKSSMKFFLTPPLSCKAQTDVCAAQSGGVAQCDQGDESSTSSSAEGGGKEEGGIEPDLSIEDISLSMQRRPSHIPPKPLSFTAPSRRRSSVCFGGAPPAFVPPPPVTPSKATANAAPRSTFQTSTRLHSSAKSATDATARARALVGGTATSTTSIAGGKQSTRRRSSVRSAATSLFKHVSSQFTPHNEGKTVPQYSLEDVKRARVLQAVKDKEVEQCRCGGCGCGGAAADADAVTLETIFNDDLETRPGAASSRRGDQGAKAFASEGAEPIPSNRPP